MEEASDSLIAGAVLRWEEVASKLEAFVTGPTPEQTDVAKSLKIEIDPSMPAPVAAVILKSRLSDAIIEPLKTGAEIPENLTQLEEELGLEHTKAFITGTFAERDAWFKSRYILMTVNGLKKLQPRVSDVVVRADDPNRQMVISSIGENGRIYMKGGNGLGAWPNHLTLIARQGESEDHESMVQKIDAQVRNSRVLFSPSSNHLEALSEFRISHIRPTGEVIRELEDLLESGESGESPFQRLVELHPELLASLVSGHWGTYVIPQQKLGAEHVTDFLVLGLNSLGPQWLAVELEAPRHELLTQKERLRSEVHHAINQIEDWREWLTTNVAYAQMTLHLHGLTNKVPGLVVIGRDAPHIDRQPARSRISEEQNIQVHSWDWVLRQARRLEAGGLQISALETSSDDVEVDFI